MRAIKLSLVLNHWPWGEGEGGSFAKCQFLYLIDYLDQSCFGSRLMADKKQTMTERVDGTQGRGSRDDYLVDAIKIMSTLLFVGNEKQELNEQAPFADGKDGNGFRDSSVKLARQQQSNFHMNNYPTVGTGTSFISI